VVSQGPQQLPEACSNRQCKSFAWNKPRAKRRGKRRHDDARPRRTRRGGQVKRKPSKPKRRSQIEATLAKFEAMDPRKLDADQRKFRSLAIRALKIELQLRAKGLID
jgi:hypothetical protein